MSERSSTFVRRAARPLITAVMILCTAGLLATALPRQDGAEQGDGADSSSSGAREAQQHQNQEEQASSNRRASEAHGARAEDRRNPRRIRRASGRGDGPRMTASGMSIGNEDDLTPYRRLEPLIGTFNFEGRQWSLGTGEESTFTGVFINTWELDGQYLRSQFTVDDDGNGYTVIGFTCFDTGRNRYEALFMNNRGSLRTHRFGNFDRENRLLSMFSRSSAEDRDAEPQSKVAFEILSDDQFRYSGWQRLLDEDEWRKIYEFTATRMGSTAETLSTAEEDQSAAINEQETGSEDR